MKERRIYQKSLVFLIFVFVLLLLIVFLFSLLLIYLEIPKFGHVQIERKFSHHFSEYDSLTNATRIGVFLLSKELKDSEYINYKIGKHLFLTILSKFSVKNYECTGSCFCESERKSILSLKRGLFFIVSSMSSILAISIASDYFSSKCVSMYSESCESPEGNIFYEVEKCEEQEEEEQEEAEISSVVQFESHFPKEIENEIYSRDDYYYDPDSKLYPVDSLPYDEESYDASEDDLSATSLDGLDEYRGEDMENQRIYKCRGSCFISGDLKRNEVIQAAEEFRCEEKEVVGYVQISKRVNSKDQNLRARYYFKRDYLKKFCKDISSYTYTYSYFRHYSNRSQKRKAVVSLCVANSALFMFDDPNVHCTLVDLSQ